MLVTVGSTEELRELIDSGNRIEVLTYDSTRPDSPTISAIISGEENRHHRRALVDNLSNALQYIRSVQRHSQHFGGGFKLSITIDYGKR